MWDTNATTKMDIEANTCLLLGPWLFVTLRDHCVVFVAVSKMAIWTFVNTLMTRNATASQSVAYSLMMSHLVPVWIT